MNDAIIKKHNFSTAKNQIQEFSRRLPANPRFEEFEEDGGLFGWFDHNVTGKEMNKFMGKVQNKLISVNSSLRGIIKEFGEIYKALDYLDNDYIKGILKAIDNAEKASEQAVSASKQALKAQDDNSKTIEALRKTVQAIKDSKTIIPGLGEKVKEWDSVKKRLESINHLDDMDVAWNQIQEVNLRLDTLMTETDSFKKLILPELDDAKKKIEDVCNQLALIEHLGDIDGIWIQQNLQAETIDRLLGDAKDLLGKINSLSAKQDDDVRKVNSDIQSLQTYINHVKSFKHLGDIDSIWNSVEEAKIFFEQFGKQLKCLEKQQDISTKELEDKIKVLADFQSHLSSFEHIDDIDNIWVDLHNQSKSLVSLSSHFTEMQDAFLGFKTEVTSDIQSLQTYINHVKSFKHLGDIDSIWNSVEEAKIFFEQFGKQLKCLEKQQDISTKELEDKIKVLADFQSHLSSFEHIDDIDNIWVDLHNQSKSLVSLSSHFTEMQDAFFGFKTEVTTSLESIVSQQEATNLSLRKKLKYAYCIGGGAILLSVLSVLLQYCGVL